MRLEWDPRENKTNREILLGNFHTFVLAKRFPYSSVPCLSESVVFIGVVHFLAELIN